MTVTRRYSHTHVGSPLQMDTVADVAITMTMESVVVVNEV